MSIEAIKTMKEQIMSCVQGQMGDLKNVNTKELGEAIDMIKDLSEAAYYCTITEAMEKGSGSQENKLAENINYYSTPMTKMYPAQDYRSMDRNNGYMYYPHGTQGNTMNYYTVPSDMRRDPREGRSYIRRRMYMEGKEMHKDTSSQLKQLQAYLKELSTDITEMIKDASPEERTTLHQKMVNLANKIS